MNGLLALVLVSAVSGRGAVVLEGEAPAPPSAVASAPGVGPSVAFPAPALIGGLAPPTAPAASPVSDGWYRDWNGARAEAVARVYEHSLHDASPAPFSPETSTLFLERARRGASESLLAAATVHRAAPVELQSRRVVEITEKILGELGVEHIRAMTDGQFDRLTQKIWWGLRSSMIEDLRTQALRRISPGEHLHGTSLSSLHGIYRTGYMKEGGADDGGYPPGVWAYKVEANATRAGKIVALEYAKSRADMDTSVPVLLKLKSTRNNRLLFEGPFDTRLLAEGAAVLTENIDVFLSRQAVWMQLDSLASMLGWRKGSVDSSYAPNLGMAIRDSSALVENNTVRSKSSWRPLLFFKR